MQAVATSIPTTIHEGIVKIADNQGADLRNGLHRQLMKKRQSLKISESAFLDIVLQVGDDTEVARAFEALQEDRIFFPYHFDDEEVKEEGRYDADDDDDDSRTEKKEDGGGGGNSVKPKIHPPSFGFGRSVGSVRRLNYIQRRCSSSIHADVWKAYESTKTDASGSLSLGGRRNSGINSDPMAAYPKRKSDISLLSFQSRKSIVYSQASSAQKRRSSITLESFLKRKSSITVGSSRKSSVVSFGPGPVIHGNKMSLEMACQQSIALLDPRDLMDYDEECSEEDEEGHGVDDPSQPTSTEEKMILKTRRASFNIYGGEGFEIGDFSLPYEGLNHFDDSNMMDAMVEPLFNPWANHGRSSSFSILGTCADDESAKPHVLTPLNMEALQPHLPFCKQGESFWLKYSLIRDGASPKTFLHQMRGATYTLLAMETLDGEVFGAFTTSPWAIDHGYTGAIGGKSFVWRMKEPRSDADSDKNQTARERELEVYKYSHLNNAVQQCKHDRISIGGGMKVGMTTLEENDGNPVIVGPTDWGFALSFGSDMLEATSSPCVTFSSPALCKAHTDGSWFELVNVEGWTLTPCQTVDEAEMMECSNLFLRRNIMA